MFRGGTKIRDKVVVGGVPKFGKVAKKKCCFRAMGEGIPEIWKMFERVMGGGGYLKIKDQPDYLVKPLKCVYFRKSTGEKIVPAGARGATQERRDTGNKQNVGRWDDEDDNENVGRWDDEVEGFDEKMRNVI